MAKRPNAMGRIEGEPKVRWYKKVKWNVVGNIAGVVLLIALGVVGTLQYQKTIDNIKADGVKEYQTNKCEMYAKDGQKWYECDVK